MLADFRAKIQAWLERGESVQIVAPPGFGNSRFCRSLGGLYLDTNLLQTPAELVAAIKEAAETGLVVVDTLDQILTPDYQPLFRLLKAQRDQYRGQLALVFPVAKTISPQYQPLLGDLYEVISEHIASLPPLEPAEYDLFGLSPTPKQLQDIATLSILPPTPSSKPSWRRCSPSLPIIRPIPNLY